MQMHLQVLTLKDKMKKQRILVHPNFSHTRSKTIIFRFNTDKYELKNLDNLYMVSQ